MSPSFTGRQCIKGIFIVDKWIGGPLRRLFKRIEKIILSTDSIHKMGFTQPEEDEALFIHCVTSAFLIFASPTLEQFKDYYKFDSLIPSTRKTKDMAYYEGCVRRHMRFHRRSRYYLSKNPSFTPRCAGLQKQFPNARFIYLVRHPLNVVPSLMTWFSQVWSGLQKKGIRFPHREFLVDFVRHWYVDAVKILDSFPDWQVKFVYYDELVSDPLGTVESIYSWLGIPVSAEFHSILVHEKDRAKKHWGEGRHRIETDHFDPQQLDQTFAEVYERFSFKSSRGK